MNFATPGETFDTLSPLQHCTYHRAAAEQLCDKHSVQYSDSF